MKIKYLITVLSFVTLQSQAEDLQPLNESTGTAAVQVSFPSAGQKEKMLGQLKLSNQKKNVKLEFEGTGLQKGKYKIVIAENCRVPKNNKKFKFASELYLFTTEYGEISSEQNLSAASINEIDMNEKSIVLLKTGKSEKIISCGEMTSI